MENKRTIKAEIICFKKSWKFYASKNFEVENSSKSDYFHFSKKDVYLLASMFIQWPEGFNFSIAAEWKNKDWNDLYFWYLFTELENPGYKFEQWKPIFLNEDWVYQTVLENY